jgi:hypothetical protein
MDGFSCRDLALESSPTRAVWRSVGYVKMVSDLSEDVHPTNGENLSQVIAELQARRGLAPDSPSRL